MMLGPKAFGFPVGQRLKRFKKNPRWTEITIQAEQSSFWFYFTLPVPKDMHETHATTESCLINMLLFLIAPKLKFIPSFNLGGEGWQLKVKVVKGGIKRRRVDGAAKIWYPIGEIKTGFTCAGEDFLMLMAVTVTNPHKQDELRRKAGEQHYAAMPESIGQRRNHLNAERRASGV